MRVISNERRLLKRKGRLFILPTSAFILAFHVVSQETRPLLFRKARTATGRRLYK